jgi:S-sulfo-L-cysteine synthase (O-acetyl-L-serine-dependent)
LGAILSLRTVNPAVGSGKSSVMAISSALAVPEARTSLLERIGNTPLVRLQRVGREFPHVEFYAKAEWFNPGGSVKDRAALNMVLEGERSGKLRPGKIILDSTSGNTGIAFGMIGAVKGYAVKLCLPASASAERKRILKAYGVEMVFTSAEEASDGAIRRVRQIYAADPDLYFYADQYSNDANWQAHYDGTAAEIWEQTAGRITELNPSIRTISVQPDSAFHGLEGLKHMPTAIVPKIYDPSVAHENVWVRTEEGYELVRRLAREEGLLVGVSSGAALHGCFQVARKIPRDQCAVIVTIFPDSGDKYLGERFWEEE